MICCKECLDFLHDYLEDELDPKMAKKLEEHFEDCPPCIAFLKTYKTTTKVCRDSLNAHEIPSEIQGKLAEFVKANMHKE